MRSPKHFFEPLALEYVGAGVSDDHEVRILDRFRTDYYTGDTDIDERVDSIHVSDTATFHGRYCLWAGELDCHDQGCKHRGYFASLKDDESLYCYHTRCKDRQGMASADNAHEEPVAAEEPHDIAKERWLVADGGRQIFPKGQPPGKECAVAYAYSPETARLIVAVPELADKARALLKGVYKMTGTGVKPDGFGDMVEILDNLGIKHCWYEGESDGYCDGYCEGERTRNTATIHRSRY